MSKPLVVAIPHRLGREEALRRLKNGLAEAAASFGHLYSVQEQIWTGNHLQFQVSALGQAASGSIDVNTTLAVCKQRSAYTIVFKLDRNRSYGK
jgi:hypothetical protein